MDPISHTQAYRLADKIRGVMAGAVRDDEHRGGEWEQFTGNHFLPLGSAGVEDGPVSLPHLHVDTLSGLLPSDASTNHEGLKCDRVKEIVFIFFVVFSFS